MHWFTFEFGGDFDRLIFVKRFIKFSAVDGFCSRFSLSFVGFCWETFVCGEDCECLTAELGQLVSCFGVVFVDLVSLLAWEGPVVNLLLRNAWKWALAHSEDADVFVLLRGGSSGGGNPVWVPWLFGWSCALSCCSGGGVVWGECNGFCVVFRWWMSCC